MILWLLQLRSSRNPPTVHPRLDSREFFPPFDIHNRHVIDARDSRQPYNASVIFPQLARFADVALLLLRIMIGLVFIVSGWKHLKNPEDRSKDIGLSKGFTTFLGAAELAGSLGVMFGVLAQLAAVGLILIMLGAIQKKMFVWRTGFWGSSGTNGWEL